MQAAAQTLLVCIAPRPDYSIDSTAFPHADFVQSSGNGTPTPAPAPDPQLLPLPTALTLTLTLQASATPSPGVTLTTRILDRHQRSTLACYHILLPLDHPLTTP